MPFPRLESEWERALAVDQAKLCDYLAHLCREIETNPGLVNFDRLMVLGIRVAAAGHEGADAFMLPWLAEAPSPRRLDIASAFLAGFWQAMASTSAYSVRPDLVNALIATRNSVTWDDTAAYSSLLALSNAITPGGCRRGEELSVEGDEVGAG